MGKGSVIGGFGEIIQSLVGFAENINFQIDGLNFNLWDMFVFICISGFAVWLLKKLLE